MNTELSLKYVDASNYKSYLTIILSGAITTEEITTLSQHLEDGDSIIAHQVGLPTPSELLASQFQFPSVDDHVWTILEAFEHGIPQANSMHTEKAATISNYSISQFVQRVSNADWDVSEEMARLNIPI
ncbi:hypothetical protein KIH87_04530 [Paraneptunicella aestuarii]|uniref:hypothetical protein n=1 Tax=Paraneptunicella aestuarii TaxID=2831148 RepID=UPI001E6551F5|nr:hypothetical protein [Paraneptunicella aestuarii]UAA39629.1 hypothetical protein KIH87_04530 [Paraneptunicella aestuarii]